MTPLRGPLTTVTATAFDAVAKLRHGRAVHTKGRVVEADWQLHDETSALGRALGTAETPAVVRLSRSVGLPEQLPDLLGVAVRLLRPEPVDLLFASVGSSRWASYVLLPVKHWDAARYSTLLPFASPQGRVLLGLRPTELHPGDGLAFEVTERHGTGEWRVVGRLRLGEAYGGAGADRPITFDPMLHAAPGLRPVPFLSRIREAAYIGSRRGRGRADEETDSTPAG